MTLQRILPKPFANFMPFNETKLHQCYTTIFIFHAECFAHVTSNLKLHGDMGFERM